MIGKVGKQELVRAPAAELIAVSTSALLDTKGSPVGSMRSVLPFLLNPNLQ